MNRALLGAALVAAVPFALAVPASAHSFSAGSLGTSTGMRDSVGARTAGHGVRVHRGYRGRSAVGIGSSFANNRFGRARDYAYGYGGGGGYYDEGDYDANRSFDPDKWNDWWHERPERSFPRWVWRNRGCTEDRMWWSGAGWRCTP